MSHTDFSTFGLGQALLDNLSRLGISAPTPVQIQAMPTLLSGKDLIASAPTGTGKTAAFMLPSLTRLEQPSPLPGRGPRVVVLTPTRELAQQVSKCAIDFARGLKRVKVVCVTGGTSYREQNRWLSGPFEVLVATPGRLMDQMGSGRIDLGRVEVLVLDEADRMLDMGFSDDVLSIASMLPASRQTVCFTATVNQNIRQLAGQLMKSPEMLSVAAPAAQPQTIEQKIIYADDVGHKRRLLDHWLADVAIGQAVVFTATKRDADELAGSLAADGHGAVALHGDLEQRQRTRMLNRLRRGEARVLVATDVAARGIDVPGITHVFNYDLPKFAEDYVHRIGRTGRAGASGQAVSFVARHDLLALKRIERFIGQSITVSAIQGLEARFAPTAHMPSRRPAGKGGKFAGKPAHGKPAHGKPGFGKPGASSGGFGKSGASGGGFGKPSGGNPGYGKSHGNDGAPARAGKGGYGSRPRSGDARRASR